MSKKSDILKALPFLKDKQVDINEGQYVGTVTAWSAKYVDMKDVQTPTGFQYAYTIFFWNINKIKIQP